MGQSRPLFVYFCDFLITISIQIEKSKDGVLGIRTQGRRMVGAGETTEQWWPPQKYPCLLASQGYLYLKTPSLIMSSECSDFYGFFDRASNLSIPTLVITTFIVILFAISSFDIIRALRIDCILKIDSCQSSE